MTKRKLTRAEIIALPEDQGFAAILEHFTEDERAVLAEAADQINALPADKRLELAQKVAEFAKNRVTN